MMALFQRFASTLKSFFSNWIKLLFILSFYNIILTTAESLKTSTDDTLLGGDTLSGSPHAAYVDVETLPYAESLNSKFNQKIIFLLDHFSSMFSASKEHSVYSLYCYVIFSALLVGMTGIIPLVLLPVITLTDNIREGKNKPLNRLLSFGLGSMLGDVFLHLLPESWSSINYVDSEYEGFYFSNGIYVLFGIISFFVLEKFFLDSNEGQILESVTSPSLQNENSNMNNNNQATPYHSLPADECKKLDDTETKNHVAVNIKPSGYLNLFANAIDNFTHGLAVGSSYLISTRVGIITTLAILFHEIPHEVGDFAVLLRAGFSKMSAAKMQIVTASGSVLGALTALSGGNSSGWILPFTSGGFIYIALSTVVPDLMEETSFKESFIHLVCMVLAICTMHALSFID